MSDEITAEIVETPKQERPELWGVVGPSAVYPGTWYIDGPYPTREQAAKNMDPSDIIIRIPGEKT